jgi:L-ascorbate metabolism protein UlaG (beta-lactamase superfamily)
MATTLTWLGHAAFRIDTDNGKRIYVDPFLNGNPKCPESEQQAERCDLVVLTHAHGDHVGDTVAIHKQHECPVVAQVELREWLTKQGVADDGMAHSLNKGGSATIDGIRVTLTNAFHSAGTNDAGYGGEACGVVLTLEDGKRVYFAGDTCVFGDMQLIARLYRPDVAVLPIGDHFTMGPEEAAVAIELLGNPRVVPCHYGTFGLLTGSPDALRKLAPDARIDSPEPGGSIEL